VKGDPSPGRARSLVCRVRTRLCALLLDDVVETMRPLPIEALPGAPSFVCGLSMIRGVPVPVVDAGALLEAPDPPQPTRFVSVKAGHRHVALAVEEVLGVRDLPVASLRDLPPLLEEAGAGVVSAVATLDSAFFVVLRAARLVPDAAWAAMETRPTA
jgi:purine-binding chemotaxis protein CheW